MRKGVKKPCDGTGKKIKYPRRVEEGVRVQRPRSGLPPYAAKRR